MPEKSQINKYSDLELVNMACIQIPPHMPIVAITFNMAHGWVGGPYGWTNVCRGLITSIFFHPYLLVHGLHLACVVGRLL